MWDSRRFVTPGATVTRDVVDVQKKTTSPAARRRCCHSTVIRNPVLAEDTQSKTHWARQQDTKEPKTAEKQEQRTHFQPTEDRVKDQNVRKRRANATDSCAQVDSELRSGRIENSSHGHDVESEMRSECNVTQITVMKSS